MPLSVTRTEVKCLRKASQTIRPVSASLARHPRSVAVNELVNKAPPLDVPWPFRHVRETPTVGAMKPIRLAGEERIVCLQSLQQ
jgi:hypothetical protein